MAPKAPAPKSATGGKGKKSYGVAPVVESSGIKKSGAQEATTGSHPKQTQG